MIRYRTRWRARRLKRPAILPAAIIVLSIALTLFADRALSPVMVAIAEERATILVGERIGSTIEELLHINVNSDELVTIERDEHGRVTVLRPDSLRISRLAAQVTLAVQDELKRMQGEKFSIPLGQALGTSLIAGLGPGIPVIMYPLGSATVFVGDKFEDAGINQTRHVIYLDVNATIRVVIPLQRRRVEISARFPVSDTVIVGEVPFAYFRSKP